MADKKISELTSITGANVSDTNDTIAIVDSSAGQTKKITRAELFKDVDGAEFTGTVTAPQFEVGSNNLNTETDIALAGQALVASELSVNFGTEASGSIPFKFYTGLTNATGGIAGGTLMAEIRDDSLAQNPFTLLKRDTADARYAQLSGAEFTGDVTLGSGQNYLGNTSGATLNFLRTSGPAYIDSARTNTEGDQIVFRNVNNDTIGIIKGTESPTANTLMTRDKSDARYAKLTGATFTGAIALNAPQYFNGADSGRATTFWNNASSSDQARLYQHNAGFLAVRGDNGGANQKEYQFTKEGAGGNETVLRREDGDARYLPERGSNANGEYVRFPDGTQICTSPDWSIDVTTSTGSLYRSNPAQTWTFPATFVSTNGVVGSVSVTGNSQTHWGVLRTTSTTSAGITVFGPSSISSRSVRAVAIGRWF